MERRLRRNLSRGYHERRAVLSRVRGRIDLLPTVSRDLPRQGAVACRFEDFTFDTPRNRLVRAGLDAIAGRVADRSLGHDCRRLAGDLGRSGVAGLKPSRAETSADRIGRHDAEDALMVALARLVFDLLLPTEDAGGTALTRVEKDEALVRALFEKAVGNIFAAELRPEGWRVDRGKTLKWQVERASAGMADLLPGMKTDIILDHPGARRRIVIDTKFTEIVTSSQHRQAVLKSAHIYQLYAYLRSQEQPGDPLSLTAEGLLLHPTVCGELDETVRIQGHDMRFATVDLTRPGADIIEWLRQLPTTGLARHDARS